MTPDGGAATTVLQSLPAWRAMFVKKTIGWGRDKCHPSLPRHPQCIIFPLDAVATLQVALLSHNVERDWGLPDQRLSKDGLGGEGGLSGRWPWRMIPGVRT